MTDKNAISPAWSAAIKKNNHQRTTFKTALLAGETIRAAAKIAGVDMLKARLWAGEADVKNLLQSQRQREPVTYFQKGLCERIEPK